MRTISLCCGIVLACVVSNIAAAEGYNLAHSATIVTSDPSRIDGTRAGRLEEFPAADVFLTTHLQPDQRDVYTVPVSNGTGCIGLDWAERRLLSQVWMRLAADCADVPTQNISLQYWSSQGREDNWSDIGQTPWQGKWEKLPGQLDAKGKELRFAVDSANVPEFKKGQGTLRIRWLFSSPPQQPIKVAELGATSPSSWTKGLFRIERDGPAASGAVTIQAYNGDLLGADDQPVATVKCGVGQPCDLSVLHCSSPSKPDRTSLRITTARGMFTVAVADVLANEGVYVKDFGAYITRAQGGSSLDEYRRKHAGDKTILQRVREMPDQTFEQAMKTLWDPMQNNGPTLLSLAADNRKFIVQRTGEILFKTDKEHLRITPAFGNARTRLDRLDWGSVGLDTGVVPPGGKGQPLQIKDKKYTKGLGLHANSQFAVDVAGQYAEFQADVGVQWQGGGDCGQVTFQVLVDGEKKLDTGMMKQADAPRPVKVSLTGAKQLVLIASTGPDIGCAVADWAEARLLRADGTAEYLSDLHAADRKISATFTRKLERDWYPIPVNSVTDNGIRYTQTTYVRLMSKPSPQDAFSADEPDCVADFVIENTNDIPWDAGLSFRFDSLDGTPLKLTKADRCVEGRQGRDCPVWLDCSESAGMSVHVDNGVTIKGTLLRGETATFTLFISSPKSEKVKSPELTFADPTFTPERYWQDMLAGAMQVETPEPLLNDFIRSTQVRCLMAARNEADGKLIAPWIAADTYGPLDTEAQAVILGMDLFGHHEFARRCHEFFVNSYNADGMLAKGYTLMGTGQHLWTLAQHVRLTRDDEWLRKMAPQLLKPCDWINRQREKTRRTTNAGDPVPESGLVPPGVLADWNRYAYYFYANAHYYAGMKSIADGLARIQHPGAEELARSAASYRNDIMRAYRWNQERMPVLPLRDGTFVPPTPSSLYCYGQTRDFHGGVSATGHDVEVGGNHLVPLGLIDPASWQAGWIIDYMEDRWFLIDGIFNALPAAENEKDWFNRGGFAKLQPHYARTSDLHALRDDVKPFIRTYFNTFPVLLNRENLTYWEHMKNGGAWDKTHESGWFLQMTRTMLVAERGRELWLAPFVTNNWLKPGMRVSVKNAPTYFGRASYELAAANDRIEATVNPPEGEGLDQIIIRLRHPEGKPMRHVTVDGQEHTAFDPKLETVALKPGTKPIHVVAQY